MTRVLAIDWGKAVGMALWEDGQHEAWVSDWDLALDELVPAFVYGSPAPPSTRERRVDLVVCEAFIISERTTKSASDGWKRGRELMFIGATEFMCRQTGVEFVTQTPADAKSFATDEKLRRMGWWTAGKDHSRDASRHMLLALTKRKLIDPRLLLSHA